ncbi:MAG: PAS domain-containing protein [Candidatus Electrothrix sp. ATG2]|nr:PAS domain-containing protein [Candidatus Electrothrix sp. ATG2]
MFHQLIDLKAFSFTILNAISCPIIIIDSNYHIVTANTSACKLFGSSIDSIVGHECFRVTHNLDKPCWQERGLQCPAKTAFELKEQVKVIHQHNHLNRAVFEQIIATPFFDDQDNPDFVIEEFNDITELVQSREVTKQLKEAVKTLHDLLPICSSCKDIRDSKGHWEQVESYITSHSEVRFTHSLCEKCMESLYGDEEWFKEMMKKNKSGCSVIRSDLP